MDWENRSHNVVPASPWSDGMEVGMPSGWLSHQESQDAGIGANVNRFQVGSRLDSGDGNGSDGSDILSIILDRQLCGNITDGYLQVISKVCRVRMLAPPMKSLALNFLICSCSSFFARKESLCC